MNDLRSHRIAVLSNAAVDAPGNAPGTLAAELVRELEQEGWGLVQLPPAGLHGLALDRAMNIVLDQLHDWAANGYQVVLIGVRDEAAGDIDLFLSAGSKRRIWFAPIAIGLPHVGVALRIGVHPEMVSS